MDGRHDFYYLSWAMFSALISVYLMGKGFNASMFILAAAGGIWFVLSQHLMILLAYSFVMILINGPNPVMEKVATASPYGYGKIRIWGTIGYALGTQCAGLLYDRVAPEAIFVAFVFTMALCIVGLLGTEPRMKSENTETAKKQGGAKGLLTNGKYLYFLVILGLFIGVTSFGNTYILSEWKTRRNRKTTCRSG